MVYLIVIQLQCLQTEKIETTTRSFMPFRHCKKIGRLDNQESERNASFLKVARYSVNWKSRLIIEREKNIKNTIQFFLTLLCIQEYLFEWNGESFFNVTGFSFASVFN
jgi:hypothetical protein